MGFELERLTNGHALQFVSAAVMRNWHLFSSFNFVVPRVQSFLAHQEANYLKNPYHNSIHAADVTQTTHCLLVKAFKTGSGKPSGISEIEVFAAVFAALSHDVGHPGVTNDFRVADRDEGAITYNDKSVNENMHCTLTYRAVEREDLNFLAALSRKQFASVRKMVICIILATDM